MPTSLSIFPIYEYIESTSHSPCCGYPSLAFDSSDTTNQSKQPAKPIRSLSVLVRSFLSPGWNVILPKSQTTKLPNYLTFLCYPISRRFPPSIIKKETRKRQRGKPTNKGGKSTRKHEVGIINPCAVSLLSTSRYINSPRLNLNSRFPISGSFWFCCCLWLLERWHLVKVSISSTTCPQPPPL